jgi:hypothetical protein
MDGRYQRLLLGAFSLTVLGSMLNVACSRDADNGTTEGNFTTGPTYGYGHPHYGPTYGGYGYAAAVDLGDDSAPADTCTPAANVFCRCADGVEGTKQCAADGQSFSSCTCAY